MYETEKDRKKEGNIKEKEDATDSERRKGRPARWK